MLVGSIKLEFKDDIDDVFNMFWFSSFGIMGCWFYKKMYMKLVEDGFGYIVMLDGREFKIFVRKLLKVFNVVFVFVIVVEWEW